MLVKFKEEYLRNLYEKGESKDKKHRYQPDIIKKYKRCIDLLKAADKKEDLYPIKSLNFESLKGSKEGLFSVRAGLQYRVEFTLNEDAELVICEIVDLSNHYD